MFLVAAASPPPNIAPDDEDIVATRTLGTRSSDELGLLSIPVLLAAVNSAEEGFEQERVSNRVD
jgi:hypothetical protein